MLATQPGPNGVIGFIAATYGLALLYAGGFGLLGLAIAGAVRHRGLALLLGLVLLFGCWDFVSPLPSRLYGIVIQFATHRSVIDPSQHPILQTVGILLRPPQTTVDYVQKTLQSLASNHGTLIASRSGLLLHGAGLGCFALFWLVIAWVAFPRTVRMQL